MSQLAPLFNTMFALGAFVGAMIGMASALALGVLLVTRKGPRPTHPRNDLFCEHANCGGLPCGLRPDDFKLSHGGRRAKP